MQLMCQFIIYDALKGETATFPSLSMSDVENENSYSPY